MTHLRATLGSRLNEKYLDSACQDVIFSLASLPPATVKDHDDMMEFHVMRRCIQRPEMENSNYYFTCDPCGNTYPKIVQTGNSELYTLSHCLDPWRFDRVTVQEFSTHHRHFLLRPQEEITYPFGDVAVYSQRKSIDLLYNGYTYTMEFRTAWKFPSQDVEGNIFPTRPMRECFVTTQYLSFQALMEVVEMCTPPAFGKYMQVL
jgi:hypothetical protein